MSKATVFCLNCIKFLTTSTSPKVVEEYLEDYNSVSNAPMKLVMFLDAIEHVSRVTRVIRLPQVGLVVVCVLVCKALSQRVKYKSKPGKASLNSSPVTGDRGLRLSCMSLELGRHCWCCASH